MKSAEFRSGKTGTSTLKPRPKGARVCSQTREAARGLGRSPILKSPILRDTKGAVMAEFVIAIVPLMMTFFSFVQLSKIATARLVVKHGAIVGARAGAVISNAHDNTPDATGDGQGDINAAVKAAMGPWTSKGSISGVSAQVQDASSKDDPYGWVTVTVTATYRCQVPMGFIACGGGTKQLKESFRMPHQGANYKLK